MNKKFIYTLALISLGLSLNAQFSVDTPQPKGIFHVDGAKDNPTTANSQPSDVQLSNDVIIRSDANIGIGTLPEDIARVSIKTNTANQAEIGHGFRLKDGTEGNGNLLVLQNTQGDIAWKKRIATVTGTWGAGYNGDPTLDMQGTGTTIKLPPGRWLVRVSAIIRIGNFNGTFKDGLYARLSWAENNAGVFTLTPDAVSGNLFGGTYIGIYSLAFGQTIINNTSTTTKTYELVNRSATIWGTIGGNRTYNKFAGSGWGENAIIAFAAN